MSDLRKAAEMALEFVEWFCGDDHSVRPKHKAPEIAEALRQALAQPEQKREWIGLTDEEVSDILDREIGFNSCWGPETDFARAIETKLKEKNT